MNDAPLDLVPDNLADIKTEPEDDTVPEPTHASAQPSFTVMDAYDWALRCYIHQTRVYPDYVDPYEVLSSPFRPCLGPEDQLMSHYNNLTDDEWDEHLPQSRAVPISHFWTQ